MNGTNGGAWLSAWAKFREVLPIAIVLVGGSIGYLELRMDAKIHAKVPPEEVKQSLVDLKASVEGLRDNVSDLRVHVARLDERIGGLDERIGLIVREND